MKSQSKLDQIRNNLFTCGKSKNLWNISFNLNTSTDLKNHWLAGFSDADASFQIKLINRKGKTEVRLNYEIARKSDQLLVFIKTYLGGNIGYRKYQDTYYYGSTSFGSAKNVINYFNLFHMLSNKHVNYLKWRKAYIVLASHKNKHHLTSDDLDRITKLKNTMNRSQKNAI